MAAPRPTRAVDALEAGTFFLLLLVYIWHLQRHLYWSWLLLLAILLASHAARGETPASLGVCGRGFAASARSCLLPVLVLAGALYAGGLFFHTVRPVPPVVVAEALSGYYFWALFQQYLLNGYLVTRFAGAMETSRRYLVVPLAGILFAAVHVPNVLLMSVTLIGGMLAAALYLRHRNLLFLAFAHALIGTMLWLVIPDAISHHLRVGPQMLHAYAREHVRPHRARGGDPLAHAPFRGLR